MKQLNLYWLGGGGGSSVPDGRTVTPVNDVTLLQQCAGISNPTYTSLSQILGDTGILQTILSNQNAVNYLVRCKDFIKQKSVPTMTSNTTPSGLCFSSQTAQTNYECYKAFDGNNSTFFASTIPQVGHNIGYKFAEPVIITSFYYLDNLSAAKIKFQGSNDGVTYTDLITNVDVISSVASVSFNNNTAYQYYRTVITQVKSTSNSYAVYTLRLYSDPGFTEVEDAMRYIGLNNYAANTLLDDPEWFEGIVNSTYFERVRNVKVPIMTSDTAPSGIASANSISPYSGGIKYAYGVFDGNDGSYVPFYGSNKYVQYTFPSEIKGACAILNIRNSFVGNVKAYINNEWVDLTENITFSQLNTNIFIPFNQCTPLITTFRFNIVTNAEENYLVNTLQFYGRKDI